MTRVMWLLHRTAGLLLLGIAVVVCAVLVFDGLTAAGVYEACKLGNRCLRPETLEQSLHAVLDTLPCLLGVFGAAPLLGQEAELGTLRLAWTQSVTRGRWTLVTLGLTLAAVVAAAGLMAAAGTWWASRWAPAEGWWSDFDLIGLALVAYTAFAVAAGLAFAAVIGRTLPAMILTLSAFVGLRLLVEVALRPRFLPPLTLPASSAPLAGQGPSVSDWTFYGPNGVTYYQPVTRFWLFQGIEAAIFLTLAAILIAVAASWLTRRAA
jgi:hypothetical protein